MNLFRQRSERMGPKAAELAIVEPEQHGDIVSK
jgi:hypothetical protein